MRTRTGTGLTDGWEVFYYNDFTSSSADTDTDGDGLSALREQILGSDPTLEDTDRDGYSDSAEDVARDRPGERAGTMTVQAACCGPSTRARPWRPTPLLSGNGIHLLANKNIHRFFTYTDSIVNSTIATGYSTSPMPGLFSEYIIYPTNGAFYVSRLGSMKDPIDGFNPGSRVTVIRNQDSYGQFSVLYFQSDVYRAYKVPFYYHTYSGLWTNGRTLLFSHSALSTAMSYGYDEKLYFGDASRYINAKYVNGTDDWNKYVNTRIGGSIAVSGNNTLYAGVGNALWALNQDGDKIWSFATNDSVESSPCIGPDGTIYVGSLDNHLYFPGPPTAP